MTKLLPRLGRRGWAAVFAVLAAAVLLGNRGMRSLAASWWSLRGLRADLAAARREEAQLADRIAAAKGDDRALERAARAELGYQRPGEIEYRFPKPRESSPAGQAASYGRPALRRD